MASTRRKDAAVDEHDTEALAAAQAEAVAERHNKLSRRQNRHTPAGMRLPPWLLSERQHTSSCFSDLCLI